MVQVVFAVSVARTSTLMRQLWRGVEPAAGVQRLLSAPTRRPLDATGCACAG
jgi:hypothetical protein